MSYLEESYHTPNRQRDGIMTRSQFLTSSMARSSDTDRIVQTFFRAHPVNDCLFSLNATLRTNPGTDQCLIKPLIDMSRAEVTLLLMKRWTTANLSVKLN